MLQIRLLGQFDVRMEGKRVTIPSRAGQSLLAYLALTAGTPHRREKLAGIFWPDTTDENARKNLRQELWRIRKALSVGQPAERDYLLADEFTLAFNREAKYWLDVFQMERPDLDLQSLIGNLSLYQGELLPGFYDEWITLERERIQAIFEARMEQLLEGLITAERWLAVQEWGERWLTLSNVREPAYRALMLASGVRGDIAKVASLYQRCTEELLEYIGVEPSAETRALYDGLLKGTKVAPRTAAQPSGTITFLFSDIEGSTHLLETMGDQYAVALGEHHEILRAAIQKWNGREVDRQGDSFFVTFTRALDAVHCAAEAQRALAAHTWHQGEHLRVRMGLHTGEPLIASTGYVGMDVHRAARIGDAGHGGQILLSQTTRELVIHDLPDGMAIRDLGEYRLKDMKYPASIYQLVVEGLPDEFAPIRTKFTGAEAPTLGEAPFKGLEFFDVEDSNLFFGRETLTAKLLNRLHDAKFLSVIIGASGSGKSSLVRAGLVPAIKKGGTFVNGKKPPDGSANWQVHIITPTAHPLEALAIELTRDSESVTAAATLVDDLSKDPRSLHFFLSRRAQTSDTSHTLLVIDQFEELFTLCRDEFEREAFIDNLLIALTPAPPPLGEERKGDGSITLIITLRADFYAYLAQYPELRDAVAQGQEYIGPMTTDELRSAIEEPARRGHWEFEPGLVDLILRDVGDEPGALPLLSHALLETWKRRAGHRLTLKGYADAGGVHGAIAHTTENVYQNLSTSEQTIMRNILLRLTEFGEGTEDTRRRASFDELMSHAEDAHQVRAVLNRLAEARLVTLSEDTAEVAHEALIREWPQLRKWLSQDREGILLHRHLTEASHEWELLERDADALYRGARLAQASEWSALNPNALNAQERMFLDASNTQAKWEEQEREEGRQRELDLQRQRADEQMQAARQLKRRAVFLTGALIIAGALAVAAVMFGQRSSQEARLSASRELAAAAVSNLDVDPERSVLLAVQAVSTAHTIEAEDALHQAVVASHLQLTLLGHKGGLTSIAVSPDGTHIATASLDGTVKIWDSAMGKELQVLDSSDETSKPWESVMGKELLPLQGHSNTVWSVAFSHDGSQLVTARLDKTAKVLDVASGKTIVTLTGHIAPLTDATFSPDGTHVATASNDGITKIWDIKTGKKLLDLASGPTFAVAYSPDGTQIATANADGIAKVWDANNGNALLALSAHNGNVLAVTFSPDGTRLATAGSDGTAKMWDVSTGENLLTLSRHGDSSVYAVAFSADGSRLATASLDNTAKVWSAVTGRELFTLSGHTNYVTDVAFSPDGLWLVTASIDSTAKVWDASPSHELFALTPPLTTDRAVVSRAVSAVAISPDGTWLATVGNEVFLWDMATGELLYNLIGHTGFVHSVAFSPDGTLLATASNDETARVWDLTSHSNVLILPVGQAENIAVAFSPDGQRLAATSNNNTTKVWDISTALQETSVGDNSNVATDKELLTLRGHNAPVWGIVFSPDGTRLATASQDGARVWDAATGEELLLLNDDGAIYGIAFSPDGTRLATSSEENGMVTVRDAATGKQLLSLFGHTRAVYAVAFTPDGSRLVTASGDATVKIWDVVSGEELLTLYGHTARIFGVVIGPDGMRLATASQDGTSRVYLLKIEDLVKLARSRLTRSLTTEECQKYLHVDECPSMP